MASASIARYKEQLEKVRAAGRNVRARAKEKTGALIQRGSAAAAGYAIGYYEREGKELPGAKIEQVGRTRMNAIAGMPAATVYSVAGTLLQLVLPQGGVMAKVGDFADGAMDGLMAVGAFQYAGSRDRNPASGTPGASGVDMGAEDEVPY